MTRNIKYTGLFPETQPIGFNIKHFNLLNICFKAYPDSVLQKNIVRDTKYDKTTVSELKSDLIRHGWNKETNLGSAKEVAIKLCRINEIKLFLSQWNYIGQTVFIRPHDINARGFIVDKPKFFNKALNSFTGKYRVQISEMNNNRKYSFTTDYGKIIFHLKGNMIEFWINGFILPVLHKDVVLLGDYISNGIEERLCKMHSILKEHFGSFRIKIQNIVVLRKISTGIVTKKNASKILKISSDLKKLGLYRDNSVYGCDEWECSGKIDSVLNRIIPAVNLIFEKQFESDVNDE
jgi:hypothetical protein